jgi:hypothetical protein
MPLEDMNVQIKKRLKTIVVRLKSGLKMLQPLITNGYNQYFHCFHFRGIALLFLYLEKTKCYGCFLTALCCRLGIPKAADATSGVYGSKLTNCQMTSFL